MKNTETIYSSRGSVALNAVLIVVLVIIAAIIYKLAGLSRPEIPTQSGYGIESVSRETTKTVTRHETVAEFSDGLTNPTSSTNFAPDELGAGTTNISVFERDLNGDGRDDRITRTHVETGTAHDYDEYKIEINRGNGEYVDVTPNDFRTVRSADCALSKLRFDFAPRFRVIKIARPLGDTWDTPTPAVRMVYAITNDAMAPVGTGDAGTVCDVTQLF